MIPFWEKRKLRFREVKCLVKDQTANWGQSCKYKTCLVGVVKEREG